MPWPPLWDSLGLTPEKQKEKQPWDFLLCLGLRDPPPIHIYTRAIARDHFLFVWCPLLGVGFLGCGTLRGNILLV